MHTGPVRAILLIAAMDLAGREYPARPLGAASAKAAFRSSGSPPDPSAHRVPELGPRRAPTREMNSAHA
jgi:hypothetical protein